jgi:putative transposase
MKAKRFNEDQLVRVLKEAEASAKTKDLCRDHGNSDAAIHNGKAKYTGTTVSEAHRLKWLEQEYAKLKRRLPEAELDNAATTHLLGREWRARRRGVRRSLYHDRSRRPESTPLRTHIEDMAQPGDRLRQHPPCDVQDHGRSDHGDRGGRWARPCGQCGGCDQLPLFVA